MSSRLRTIVYLFYTYAPDISQFINRQTNRNATISFFICIRTYKQLTSLTSTILLSDQELVTRLKEEDEKAFAELYDRYWLRLYKMAYHTLRKHPESQDIVQEIFTSLWKNCKKSKIDSIAAYLYGATRKQILKVALAGQGHVALFDQIELLRIDHSTEEALALSELQARLQECMALLPPTCRQIFELNRFENRSVKEIAEMLSLSPKTVENQIFKATSRLRGSLGEYFFILFLLFYPPR